MIKSDFLKFLANICVKIFQILFAMIVIGMFFRSKFDLVLFVWGVFSSFVMLTGALLLYYNGSIKEVKKNA